MTMKLHYSKGSCSLLVHLVVEELGLALESVPVDLAAGEQHGAAYRAINPKGKVPALVADEGTLTECVAIVEWLLDRHGDGSLLAAPGTWERAKTMEQVATLATEIHPLFNRFFHEDDFAADPQSFARRSRRAAPRSPGSRSRMPRSRASGGRAAPR